ncbi:MAG: hypothetical protein KDK10_12245 [Maritimibacter sp.]|nr:hypothetical protein [Maritimibacter sp.]
MHTNNVIAFDRNRRPARASVRAVAEELRDNVIALADFQGRSRAHRTARGVFFTTGVLTTYGSAA